MMESWCRDDKGGTASYVGIKGVLPARNLRDQPGLYRSEELCGAFEAVGRGCDETLDVATLGEVACREGPAASVWGSGLEVFGTSAASGLAASPDVLRSLAVGLAAGVTGVEVVLVEATEGAISLELFS